MEPMRHICLVGHVAKIETVAAILYFFVPARDILTWCIAKDICFQGTFCSSFMENYGTQLFSCVRLIEMNDTLIYRRFKVSKLFFCLRLAHNFKSQTCHIYSVHEIRDYVETFTIHL